MDLIGDDVDHVGQPDQMDVGVELDELRIRDEIATEPRPLHRRAQVAFACRTRVGAVIAGSSSRMSTSASRAGMSRPCADSRRWSASAPELARGGIVGSARGEQCDPDAGAPLGLHIVDERLDHAAVEAAFVAVPGEHSGMPAVQDERARRFRVQGGEECRRRGARRDSEHDRVLGSGRFEYGSSVFHPVVHDDRRGPVGQTHAPLVEQDEPGERREPADQSIGGRVPTTCRGATRSRGRQSRRPARHQSPDTRCGRRRASVRSEPLIGTVARRRAGRRREMGCRAKDRVRGSRARCAEAHHPVPDQVRPEAACAPVRTR